MLRVGSKKGRLTLKECFSKEENNRKRTYWLCACDCGDVAEIREDRLKNKTNSCGCLQKERSSLINSKDKNETGKNFNNVRARLRTTWRFMKRRCYDTEHDSYKRYGGRGIRVSEDWLYFSNFYKDMADSYREGLTIDRVNVDGDYSKENCKWSTKNEQMNNKRNTRYVYYKGEKLPLSILHEKYAIEGLPFGTLAIRILRGWSLESALKTKPRKTNTPN